ncbi:phosphoglucomutase-2-like protein [Euroglyphus maynei]|uniref:Phosphoglucomutase-2-like protein n=1 Tax=Euroglyphus maynei TaxID=6958 RepID=A0A1Y3APF1_EURMA|nr:phosphoglucomutase-2-like protein [Euroglyphus maynei]
MANYQLTESMKTNIEKFPLELKEKVNDWLEWDKNLQTWNEIAELINSNDVERLSKLLLKRQCFGTAGIRGIMEAGFNGLMEAGFNGLNDLVIIQTSQGLAKYVKTLPTTATELLVVIGFDGRHHSYDFALLTTNVFRQAGFKVALFSKVVPTPFVSFAINLLNASTGIMITSSHNPKVYNGYKVFGNNGAQILSPHDKNIQNSILTNLKPWNNEIWNISNTFNYDGIQLFDPLHQVSQQYYYQLMESSTRLDLVKKSNLKITYTALHGVGHDYMAKMFEEFDFKNHYPVESQKIPDPEFPTVHFPNPEEGQGVFDESYKTAQQTGSSLIFCVDPDADRFCMGEKYDEWRIFNGNEIGALLAWWIWNEFHSSEQIVKKSDCYMISSAVSSKILETYSKREGFNFIETLTGFKWMANIAYDLEKEGKRVLFCFEEAIGFMVGTNVYDKDGISAMATMLQFAAYLHSKGQTFRDKLNEIYQTYGFHYSLNSYYLCYDGDKIEKIFNRMANFDGIANSYIKQVNGIKVIRVRDLIRGYDSETIDHKPTLPPNNMITFYFENGSIINLRTSGTEPKIKYYSEIIAPPDERYVFFRFHIFLNKIFFRFSDWEKIKTNHQELIEATVQLLLQPQLNGLIAKKD